MRKVRNWFTLFFLLLFSNSAFSLTVEIYTTPDICNYSNGTMSTITFGGIPAYTYTWSNGATTESVSGLSGGTTLTVVVTDVMGATGTATATIVSQSHLNQTLFSYAGSFPCEGMCNGRLITFTSGLGGVPPYSGTYDWMPLEQSDFPFPNGLVLTNLCWNTYPYVYLVDANGCSVNYMDQYVSYVANPVIESVIVTDATSGINGSATVMSNAWPTNIPGYYTFTYFDADGNTIPNASGSEIYSLCAGNYSVQLSSGTGYWDPATGVWYPETCSSTTAQFSVGGCAVPSGLSTAKITSTTAKLKWNTNACAISYKVRYRPVGTATWTMKSASGNNNSKKITGLTANTQYEWQLRSKCGSNPNVWSAWSGSSGFTTTLRLGEFEDVINMIVYPNPATHILTIEIDGSGQMNRLLIQNSLGQIVLEKKLTGTGNSKTQIDVSTLAPGVYLLTAFTDDGKMMKMFVKE